MRIGRAFAVIGPGLLVAATGVGAGDLATGAFSGSALGVAVLWAVVLGAFLKFVLTEGLARWQIATGETLLEGAMDRFGVVAKALFALYLFPWSYFVGTALVSACGVTAHAMLPVFRDPATGKIVFGAALSLLGILLVRIGGYRLFERVMSVCIGVMFAVVVATAVLIRPDWGAVGKGILVPSIPDIGGQGLAWTVALMGGVGGTLTVLCYGYWIREEGRDHPEQMGLARIDLGVGYLVTMLFGLGMVIIGSTIRVEGKGAGLVVALADRLTDPLGLVGRWAFLLGAFGAVFSSLLGVWQAVPYVFADFWGILRGRRRSGEQAVDTSSRPYRLYLYAIGIVPLAGLFGSFREAQKVYAVVGALFIPLLALALLVLNGRTAWVGERFRNRPLTVLALVAALALFLLFGVMTVREKLGI
jgi:Mn2+/Fe2+ NRAMP family transporter